MVQVLRGQGAKHTVAPMDNWLFPLVAGILVSAGIAIGAKLGFWACSMQRERKETTVEFEADDDDDDEEDEADWWKKGHRPAAE